MIMCHMIADTTEELLQMVDKIGVDRKWIQKKGTHQEHFDIALSMKKKALAAGAQEITWRALGEMCIKRGTPPTTAIEMPMTRLEWGEAWMMCRDCNAKLYSFDGNQDQSIPCPHPQKCRDERR